MGEDKKLANATWPATELRPDCTDTAKSASSGEQNAAWSALVVLGCSDIGSAAANDAAAKQRYRRAKVQTPTYERLRDLLRDKEVAVSPAGF